MTIIPLNLVIIFISDKTNILIKGYLLLLLHIQWSESVSQQTTEKNMKFKMFWFLISLQLARMRYHKDIIIWDRKKCLLVKKWINCITFNILQVKNLLKVKITQANKSKMCRENTKLEKHLPPVSLYFQYKVLFNYLLLLMLHCKRQSVINIRTDKISQFMRHILNIWIYNLHM